MEANGVLTTMLPLLATITNVTNESVLGNLAEYFAPFMPQVFGAPIVLGLVIILAFAGIIAFLKLSLDAAVAIMLPLVIILTFYGYLPQVLGWILLAIAALPVVYAIVILARR